MTARDAKRSALGMGRILLGVIMAICVPVWLVFSLVDFTRQFHSLFVERKRVLETGLARLEFRKQLFEQLHALFHRALALTSAGLTLLLTLKLLVHASPLSPVVSG